MQNKIKKSASVKPFSFSAMKNILGEQKEYNKRLSNKTNHKSSKNIQNHQLPNFDRQLLRLCNQMDKKYQQYSKNHLTRQFISSNNQRVKQINKLRNIEMIPKSSLFLDRIPKYSMPINPEIIKQSKKIFEKQECFEHKLEIKKKFRRNIFIIIEKMRSMRLTLDQIMKNHLISRTVDQPYRHGKEIFLAIKADNQEKVFRKIIENRYTLFSYDRTGKTPLLWASIRGNPKIVQTILKAGCQIDKQDELGNSALRLSIKYANAECVKLLLLYLIPINKQDYQMANKDYSQIKQKASEREQIKKYVSLYQFLRPVLVKVEMKRRIKLFQTKYNLLYREQGDYVQW